MAFPKLTHAFDLVIWGPPGFGTSGTKNSNLCCAHVDGGKITSPDGKHEFSVKYGSDWMLVPPNSPTLTIDARVSAETADGINLELAYLGKLTISEEIRALFDGSSRETQFGETYYYTAPRIWSRSDEFAWVNDAVFLAMGKLRLDENGRVEAWYRILKVG